MTENQSKEATKPATSLVLSILHPAMSSWSGFSWPIQVGAEMSASSLENNRSRDNGLRGWLYGQGDISRVNSWSDAGAKWIVLEVPSSDIVDLGGECKFPTAVVRFVGTKSAAADFILPNEPQALNASVIGVSLKAGDGEVAVVGSLGMAMSGNHGTATAGESGTATAGHHGTATVGPHGTAAAGESGELRIRWWDEGEHRYRTSLGYVGENGIKANTAYQLNAKHEFEEVKK